MRNILALLIVIFTISSCKNDSTSSEQEFKKSFRQLKSENSEIEKLEYFDSSSHIYSNYKYHIGFDAPNNWKFDYGLSEHTIFRTYEPDSAITFAINVIEINTNRKGNIDIWELYKNNTKEMDEPYLSYIESEINTPIENFEASKTYIKNKTCLRRQFEYLKRELDFEYYNTTISYQTMLNNVTYTLTLNIPKVFYEENSEKFEDIFRQVYFLKNQDKLESFYTK